MSRITIDEADVKRQLGFTFPITVEDFAKLRKNGIKIFTNGEVAQYYKFEKAVKPNGHGGADGDGQ